MQGSGLMNKAEKLRHWKVRLQAIADEMDTEGLGATAGHVDLILADLEFEEQALNGGGAIVTFNNTNWIGRKS